jgi:putative ABC transport system permease protein
MPFSEAVRLASDSIRAHKLRSFLTLLGVILGVFTVVAVASFIEGANVYVSQTMEDDLGANTVILDKYGIINSLDEWIAAQKRKDITMDDYRDLRERATLAKNIGINLDAVENYLRVGNQELTRVNVVGRTASMLDMNTGSISVEQGRFIADSDDENRRNVVFIGSQIREKFFAGVNPIGKELRIRGESFEVIGVAKEIGAVMGQERDKFIIIPASVHLRMYGMRQSLGVYLQPHSPAEQSALEDQVRGIMRARHHLSYNQKDDFAFFSADALKDLWASFTGVIAAVALGVTSISLVVGGIVIMNIMMVAVTERTREIGIRKSLGARSKDILRQFLVESSLLSGVGGIIGLGLAWAGMLIASSLFPIPFSMPLWAIVLSLAVSIGVGLIFGIYPAYRAARLDPITALRQE